MSVEEEKQISYGAIIIGPDGNPISPTDLRRAGRSKHLPADNAPDPEEEERLRHALQSWRHMPPEYVTEDQAEAWVCWFDEELVVRVGPYGDTTFRNLLRRLERRRIDSSARMDWRNMGGPIGKTAEGQLIYASPPGRDIYVRLSSPPQPRPEKSGSPEDLSAACANGQIGVLGRRYDNGKLERLHAAEFLEGRPEGWADLRFSWADVRRAFPPPRAKGAAAGGDREAIAEEPAAGSDGAAPVADAVPVNGDELTITSPPTSLIEPSNAPGSNGGEEPLKQKAWKLAEEILESREVGPPGHGRLTALARLIASRLGAKAATIEHYIRDEVREWEGNNTGK
jgi:hypothetical protein